MWQQELMWVKRNEQGAIVGVEETMPKKDEFVPTMPNPSEYPRKKKAAGQGD